MHAMVMAVMMMMTGSLGEHRPAPPAARQPTDAQILGILGEIHADEIEAAKLALTKASAGAVRDYARTLVDDHQTAQHDLLDLARRLHIAPQIPADSTVRHTHATVMTQLNLASGSAFDKAFMQYMLVDHEAAVEEARKTLRPAAHNPEVREMIRHLLPVLERHIVAAQQWIDRNP